MTKEGERRGVMGRGIRRKGKQGGREGAAAAAEELWFKDAAALAFQSALAAGVVDSQAGA